MSAKYIQHAWGDRIEGTKAQLQDLGLGLGKAFPGEAGGPRRAMTVRDRFGFVVRIYLGADRLFHAHRCFPDWPAAPYEWQPSIWGGVRVRRLDWWDEFEGTADALAWAAKAAAASLEHRRRARGRKLSALAGRFARWPVQQKRA